MGIPGIFAQFVEKYNKRYNILEPCVSGVDELYIDANCLFHPQCFKVLEHTSSTNIDEIENNMISENIKYIDYLIKLASPKELIYIAVDGVAPMAKINQQRKRRYKSMYEKACVTKMKKKFNMKSTEIWNNAAITPGTEFMKKLHSALMDYVKLNKRIIYSSYLECGEGEHKMLNYLRTQLNEKKRLIYGLDADLIFLTLMSHKKNIYLMRENEHNNTFNYVNIDKLTESIICNIIEEFNNLPKKVNKNRVTKRMIIDDLTFACFLLGNDFVPNIPTIQVRKFGLDLIISSYVKIIYKHESSIINEGIINIILFEDFINELASREREFFTNNYHLDQKNSNYKTRFNTQNSYEYTLMEFENLTNIPETEKDVYNTSSGNFEDWKYRYYLHHTGCRENQESMINEMCHDYLKALYWNYHYYFDECISWTWYYNYNISPYLSDLCKYIKNFKVDINLMEFEKDKPISTDVQLLCVIPPQYNELIPEHLRKYCTDDSPIIDLFPMNFKIDYAHCDKMWQCHPILPAIQLNRILNVLNA